MVIPKHFEGVEVRCNINIIPFLYMYVCNYLLRSLYEILIMNVIIVCMANIFINNVCNEQKNIDVFERCLWWQISAITCQIFMSS